ncbi:MFS antiporter QDR3 [Lecanosticta acicola]|uniref:MFS antiporter QDR3 n=1 Tax=Lecanosticta acicola TaxID=111012 RepID=A0AAI9E8D6_9PEZI|nr:MFS antiporter QDR3 [Lecanosticta acicola]
MSQNPGQDPPQHGQPLGGEEKKNQEHIATEVSQSQEGSQDGSSGEELSTSKMDQTEKQERQPQGNDTEDGPKYEVVPRSERRGLLAGLAIIPELRNPLAYKSSTKWKMTIILALTAGTSSTGSAMFYPALAEMAADLNCSKSTANLSIAFYLLIMAFTPLWWSSWSEVLGRRTVYISSFLFFVIFSVISAVSVNVAMLIVFRVLSGGAAAAVQAVGAGSCADLWESKVRGRAMSIFYLGPLFGPGVAPIIGGALAQTLGWRSTLWALVVFGGVLLILITLFLPETVVQRKPAADEGETFGHVMKKRFIDPLKTLKFLQHPPIFITVWAGGLGFAVLYVLVIAIQATFETAPYNYSIIIVGLMYIPPCLGYFVASQVGGRWTDHLLQRGARKAGRYDENGKPIFLPEDRMQENIWLAGFMYPLALIWFGWTARYGVHWIVPSIANVFFGVASMLVFSCVTTMLTEFTPKRSASGVALNNFMRQILATIMCATTQPAIDAIGVGWLCTIIALIALVTGNLAVLALKLNVAQWREKMDKKMNQPKPGGQ